MCKKWQWVSDYDSVTVQVLWQLCRKYQSFILIKILIFMLYIAFRNALHWYSLKLDRWQREIWKTVWNLSSQKNNPFLASLLGCCMWGIFSYSVEHHFWTLSQEHFIKTFPNSQPSPTSLTPILCSSFIFHAFLWLWWHFEPFKFNIFTREY